MTPDNPFNLEWYTDTDKRRTKKPQTVKKELSKLIAEVWGRIAPALSDICWEYSKLEKKAYQQESDR
jgi:hypothetical protein